MLQSIVLDDSAMKDNSNIITKENIRRTDALNTRIVTTNNAEKTFEGWSAKGENAYIVLEINTRSNSEIYIRLNEIQNMKKSTCKIDISSENTLNSIYCDGRNTPRRTGQKNFSLNIGKSEGGKMQIKISFLTNADIHIKNIEAYARPLSSYEKDIENLKIVVYLVVFGIRK